jgi:Putative MetA-pathway of phenol degradation
MQTRPSVGLLVFVLAALAPLHSQTQTATDNTAGPIVTDRPTFTNSSVVVPAGSFQAENGFLVTDRQGQDIADGPEALVRFGLAKTTELRLYVPDYYYDITAGGGQGSGFGDLAIGMKQQLGPTRGGFDVSLTAFLSFPTGAASVSSGGYDPGLQLAWSRGLSSKWTMAGMLSLYGPTVDHSHDLTGEVTILADRLLAPAWDAIVEYVGDFPERGGSRQLLHLATELRLGKQQRQQLDFHFGVGLTPAAPYHFIGIGYSFRFQAVRRSP